MRYLFVVAILAFMGVFGLSWTTFAQADQGKELFQKKMCFACHGKGGEGGSVGPSLKGLKKSKEEIVSFLKTGSKNKKMQPVKGTEEELAALADFMLSLQ